MPLHQVIHNNFKVYKSDLVVSIFVKLFDCIFDISVTKVVFVFILLSEQFFHLVMAEITVPIFIESIKCLFYVGVMRKDVNIYATHKKLVYIELLVSIDVCEFQGIIQSFPILDLV